MIENHFSTTEALEEDTPCGECGYNLRGLTVQGQCPECGTRVSKSMHRGLLRYSRPKYVWTLSRGTSWLLWGQIIVAAAQLAIWGQWLANVIIRFRIFHYSDLNWLLFAGSALGLVGAWMLATPHGHVSVRVRQSILRRLIRAFILVVAAFVAFQFAIYVLHAVSPIWLFQHVHSLQLAAPLLNLPFIILLFRFISLLCSSMPDVRYQLRADKLMWLFVAEQAISMTTIVVEAWFVGWVPSFVTPRRHAWLPVYLSAGRTVLSLVAAAINISFLIGLRRQFRTQLELSRQISLARTHSISRQGD